MNASIDAIAILQTSTGRLNYPANTSMVPILDNGTQTTGNAVMQSGALGWRMADIVFSLNDNADVDAIRALYETHEEVVYADPWSGTHSIRILDFDAQAQGNELWACTATIVETESFFNYS